MLSHPTTTVGTDNVATDGGNTGSESTVDHSGPHMTVVVDTDA
jgi:hypothetical protein